MRISKFGGAMTCSVVEHLVSKSRPTEVHCGEGAHERIHRGLYDDASISHCWLRVQHMA